MVNQIAKHDAKWLAPAPLWSRESMADLSSRNGSAWRPSILRFNTDLFMEEVLAALAYYPDRLPEWIAGPETWERPMEPPRTASKLEVIQPVSERSKKIKRLLAKKELSAPANQKKNQPGPTDSIGSAEIIPFKLYQPAHQRYYLVAASLVCQQQGMPDRRVDPGRQESTFFLLRRVAYTGSDQEPGKPYNPADPDWKEYAFVAHPDGFAWKLIEEKRDAVQTGEERLPLFSLYFNENRGNRRRVLAGLIPVGRREAYLSAAISRTETENPDGTSAEAQRPGTDPRRHLFEAKVTGPWGSLVEQAKLTHDRFNFEPAVNPFPNFDWDPDSAAKDKGRLYRTSREQIQTISWYVLLDFAKFLKTYLPDVLAYIADPGNIIDDPDDSRLEAKRKLVDILNSINVNAYKNELKEYFHDRNTEVKRSLGDALVAAVADDVERRLETVDVPYLKDPRESDRETWNPDPDPKSVWPSFLFPLADPSLADPRNGPIPDTTVESGGNSLDIAFAKIDALADLIEQALPAMETTPPEIRPPVLPLDPGNGWFVIRCVYERPNCGPLHPEAVSAPTEKFQMAAFFDPDAPVRPVRISLPMDISPAGLRKFKKNATLMMSDMLCGKVGEIRKLTFGDLVLSVLPWPFHKDLPEPDKTGPCKKGEENAGMYCSLSIPIVTLAALILMIIIVALFDMFFKWMPYLFTCFPIPGFKGKKA